MGDSFTQIEFLYDKCFEIYEAHMTLLSDIQVANPHAYHRLMHDMWLNAMYVLLLLIITYY